jgi:hypothetical protein
MRIGWIVAISFVLPVLTWGQSAAAQKSSAALSTAQLSAKTTAPAVAEQADQLLTRQFSTGLALLAGSAVAVCLTIGADRALAFRGGFGGFRGGGFEGFHGFGGGGGFGGFRGGGSRFGDGGFFDPSTDAGFGRGGWGSVHNAGAFSDRADRYQQSHPDIQHNAGQFQQSRPEYQHNASQFQQSHPEA